MLNLNKRKDSLEILNYEGPVLLLKRKEDESFELLNQWGELVETMNRVDVLAFVMGEKLVRCPRQNKIWDFTVQHKEARVSAKDLEKFLFKL